MKANKKTKNVLNNSLLRVAAATVAVLLVPLIAMQFNNGVNWTLEDFVIAGALLIATGLVYEYVIRRIKGRNRRIIFIGVLAVAFVYIWAEMAVGVFTHWGS